MADNNQNVAIRPSLDVVQNTLDLARQASHPPTLVPLSISVPADLVTPSAAYLKLSAQATSGYSFLLESATGSTETVGRYSYVGKDPRTTIKTGPGHGVEGDPLPYVESILSRDRVAQIPGIKLPPFNGGAVGYVGYDCVKYFEPKTARPLVDNLKIPEALFMIFGTVIAFDHFLSTLTIITYLELPLNGSRDDLKAVYRTASQLLRSTLAIVEHPEIPLPPQPPIHGDHSYVSNVGRAGYEGHVTMLKEHINRGNIIQAVPSQRFSRSTTLHPFNIYRQLRTLNPSPYLFYISCDDFQLVGASPELLMKTDGLAALPQTVGSPDDNQKPVFRPRVVNHAIAGTIARGKTPAEDQELADQLVASIKDRAEHVMLVDLARNDVNRVCHPMTVKVDRLMRVDRFSHVQHLTSEVSGTLRPGCTRWDALRSIFPAGTVSGAPKVRAMELIYDAEKETRGIYAGTVGWFGYDSVSLGSEQADPKEPKAETIEEGAMDTCIAIRTMLVKDGTAYLQAGGGIVFDSVEADEWMETMNKAAANMRCIELAETYFGGDKLGERSVEDIIEEERRKAL